MSDVGKPLFANSLMKIERAKGFIKELQAEFDRYRCDHPYSVHFVVGSDPPQIEVSWKATGLLPGAILGDVIHNLRTSLDLMASELARITSGSDKGVYFPFANTASDIPEMISRSNFDRCGPDAIGILETLKPYKGGNDELRAIHDLDIGDKHRALIISKKLHQLHIEGTYDILAPELGDFKVSGDVDFHFDDSSPLAGRDIIQTLEHFVQLIEGVLETFSRLVAARG